MSYDRQQTPGKPVRKEKEHENSENSPPWMAEVSRQLRGVVEKASSSVAKSETRHFRKRLMTVELSRARAQVAFFEEMLRLEEAVEQLNIRPEVERRPEDGSSGDDLFVETPTSSQPEKGEKPMGPRIHSRPMKLTKSGGGDLRRGAIREHEVNEVWVRE